FIKVLLSPAHVLDRTAVRLGKPALDFLALSGSARDAAFAAFAPQRFSFTYYRALEAQSCKARLTRCKNHAAAARIVSDSDRARPIERTRLPTTPVSHSGLTVPFSASCAAAARSRARARSSSTSTVVPFVALDRCSSLPL